MSLDAIPIWALFVATLAIVVVGMEVGYQVGKVLLRRGMAEKESAVSVVSGAMLGLVAFMLAFTFAIVSDRYEMKKGLVRDDANAIRDAWERSEFLPEPDRSEASGLLRRYLDLRLEFVQFRIKDPERVRAAFAEAQEIRDRLWTQAVVNARRDMNSDVAALYIESLNEVSRVHAMRVAIGYQSRIPIEIWIVLYVITFLGMMAAGYQTAVAESKRSKMQPILAIAFGAVIVLIAGLDRPDSGVMKVTQQPLLDVQKQMSARAAITSPAPSPSPASPPPSPAR